MRRVYFNALLAMTRRERDCTSDRCPTCRDAYWPCACGHVRVNKQKKARVS